MRIPIASKWYTRVYDWLKDDMDLREMHTAPPADISLFALVAVLESIDDKLNRIANALEAKNNE